MILTRTDIGEEGAFGKFAADDGSWAAFSLEHAYPDTSTPPNYAPKIPKGTYTCQRGMHELEGMSQPFETFEVTNVPGHTGILIHPGNTEADSSGCILLGSERQGNSIIQSRIAFQSFMKMMAGVDAFTLTVT